MLQAYEADSAVACTRENQYIAKDHNVTVSQSYGPNAKVQYRTRSLHYSSLEKVDYVDLYKTLKQIHNTGHGPNLVRILLECPIIKVYFLEES